MAYRRSETELLKLGLRCPELLSSVSRERLTSNHEKESREFRSEGLLRYFADDIILVHFPGIEKKIHHL